MEKDHSGFQNPNKSRNINIAVWKTKSGPEVILEKK